MQTQSARPLMPSIVIDLPANVERRPRTDGTYRYFFRARRNRPPEWPRLVRFHALDGGAEVSERDDPAKFAAALESWAKKLNAELAAIRTGDDERKATQGSLPWVFEQYKRDDRFTTKKAPTQNGYRKLARYVFEWSQRAKHPHVSRYTYESVSVFIDGWKHAPHQRRAIQRFLSLLFTHAMRLKLRDDNPAAAMGLSVPASQIHIWEEAELELMVGIADGIGEAPMGTAILICHEIGPREEDVIAMRAPDHYEAGMFRFQTSKTQAKLAIPATLRLRERIEKDGIPLHRFLLLTQIKKVPFKPDNFRHVFARVRAAAGAVMCAQALAELCADGVNRPSAFIDVGKLLYRQLRHTAIVQLARAACTVPEIASITGHSIKTVTQILEHYLPRDSVVAQNAIAKLEEWRRRT